MRSTLIIALAFGMGCAGQVPVYSQREPLETQGAYQQYRNIFSNGERLELSITTENNGGVLEKLSFVRVEQDGRCVREEVSDYIEPAYAGQIMGSYGLDAMFAFYTESIMVDERCDGTVNLIYATLDSHTDILKRGKDFPAETDEMLEMQLEIIDDAFGIQQQREDWQERQGLP